MTPREEQVIHSMTHTTWRFYAWSSCLVAVVACGLGAYLLQLRRGLIVTGLRDEVSWGLYIASLVFWVGVSKGGTIISAILRLTHAEWRRPMTRMAEAITVLALLTGFPLIVADLGRPDRVLNLIRYGRIQSPLVWDVISLTTYLVACVIYFYLPLIPDLALLAEEPRLRLWRRRLYARLALGWKGTGEQKHLLERAISVMAIAIIPLAVSVHTVLSWVFAMTLRPGWNSTIFGPYFVVGAIYSGAGAVVVSMWILQKVFHLGEYVRAVHFRRLGAFLIVATATYLYFNVNEYLTIGYKLEGADRDLVWSLFSGSYSHLFWMAQVLGVLLPLLILAVVAVAKPSDCCAVNAVGLSALLIVLGAWVKRFLIVVPTLETPFLPVQHMPATWTHYHPTWVEWTILAGALAAFLLAYSLLVKLFPIVSLWETREAHDPVSEINPPQPSRFKTIPAIISVVLFLWAVAVPQNGNAAAKRTPAPKPATVTLEYAVTSEQPADNLALAKADALMPGTTRALENPFAAGSSPDNQTGVPLVLLTATVRDGSGAPVAFKAVTFSTETRFGTLSLGTRPTDDQGKARLKVTDRRFGRYVVTATLVGGDEYASTSGQSTVEAVQRPAPGLPASGVLIAPFPTFWISIPFLLFFGAMWACFIYSFGYLVLFRMRMAGCGPPPGGSKLRSDEPPSQLQAH
jgi:Ni/Fe-hydrogenase subunit HybB-like protein